MTRNRRDTKEDTKETKALAANVVKTVRTGFVDGRGVQRPLRKVEFNKLSNKTLSY